MTCADIRDQLALMLYGELSFDEEERVHEHLEICLSCKSELQEIKALHAALDKTEVQLPPELLQACRRDLRMSLSSPHEKGARRSGESLSPWSRWLPTFVPPQALYKPAGACALLLIGFLGGRFVPNGFDSMSLGSHSEASAYRVRSIEPRSSGAVQIVVEETHQRVLSGDMDNRQIRSLLLSAAREAADPGVRVETVDLLKSQSESADVRGALLLALQHDVNPGVRLKALDGLRGFASDADTRKVLAQVVLTDSNPGVRTQAIDLLVQKHEPAIVGVLQELMTREDNNYIRLKCQKALSEMNASAETF